MSAASRSGFKERLFDSYFAVIECCLFILQFTRRILVFRKILSQSKLITKVMVKQTLSYVGPIKNYRDYTEKQKRRVRLTQSTVNLLTEQ